MVHFPASHVWWHRRVTPPIPWMGTPWHPRHHSSGQPANNWVELNAGTATCPGWVLDDSCHLYHGKTHRKMVVSWWFYGDLIGFDGLYPLVMTNIAMERFTIFNGKFHWKWPCSIVMLNHQRIVSGKIVNGHKMVFKIMIYTIFTPDVYHDLQYFRSLCCR